MARTVHCIKLGVYAEGLDKPPFKGELGERVFNTVSKEAWRKWLEHSKMLINEYRLDLVSEAGQRIGMKELENYFFGRQRGASRLQAGRQLKRSRGGRAASDSRPAGRLEPGRFPKVSSAPHAPGSRSG